MNRTHRIIWSEARQAFVVTHEKAKANGKPSSTRKAVASAVVMALAALAATPALAAPSSCLGGGAISISAAETSICNLTSGSSLIVTNTGSIDVSASFSADAISATGSSIGSITNDGAISGGGFNGNGISLSSSIADSITSSGTISGGSNNGDGISLSSSSITGSITNSGTISGGGGGIALSSSSVGSITNSGTISVSGTGIALYSSGSIGGSLTNSGTISVSYAGIAVYSSSSIGGSLTNSGTISASGTAGNAGRGIIISTGSSITGSLSNSGTISGAVVGIDIVGSSIGGSITNDVGGTISGGSAGILLSQSTVSGDITNSGSITGGILGISLSSGSTVGSITNNAGGTISSGGTGIKLSGSSTVTGSITNSGLISGGASVAGILLSHSNVDSITNNAGGTISGGSIGIFLSGGGTVGSITNSGTISGSAAILVASGNTLTNLNIGGNNTASFVGTVYARSTPMSILSGATYTLKAADDFRVDSFTNDGTAKFATSSSFNLTNVTGNTFTNNGVLEVSAGATGTLTDDYTQAVSGTFRTNVTDDTTYGKLVVTGTATLPTNAKIDVNVADANFAFTAASMASIISAGTLTWDGTSVVTDNSVLFDFTASKNGNAVDLVLAVASTPTPTPSSTGVVTAVTNQGNTPGIGAATVLDGMVTAFAGGGTGNADMDTVIGALGGLTTNQQVSDAASSTLPLMTGGMARATIANLNGINRIVQARMEEHRGLSSGEGFVENGKGWFKPVGSWADQKDKDGAFGYTAETYGVVLGADGERSDISRMGAAFGYTHSLVHGNSGAQSAKVDSYQFVVYGSRSLNDSMEYNWQADYAYNQNKGSRYISFVNRTAAADYTSQALHIGTGIGKTMAWKDKTSFVPSIRADYTRIADGAYTETGANALNLVVASKTVEELILSVDAKLVHSLSETSTLTANVGLGYDAMAKQNSITASYAGGGAAFTTDGIKPSASLARIGMGYVHNTDSGMEITARYDAEARSGFIAQTVSAKLRMPF